MPILTSQTSPQMVKPLKKSKACIWIIKVLILMHKKGEEKSWVTQCTEKLVQEKLTNGGNWAQMSVKQPSKQTRKFEQFDFLIKLHNPPSNSFPPGLLHFSIFCALQKANLMHFYVKSSWESDDNHPKSRDVPR